MQKMTNEEEIISRLMKISKRVYHCPITYHLLKCQHYQFSTKEELMAHLKNQHSDFELTGQIEQIEKEQKIKKALENDERVRAWLKAHNEANQK